MNNFKRIKRNLCICVFMFTYLFFSVCGKAEYVDLSDDTLRKYSIHDFCNSEMMAFIRYRTFYFDTNLSLLNFLDGETYYITYDTNSYKATGRILVLGFEGDSISSMIKESENFFIQRAYYGMYRPSNLNFVYMNPEEMELPDLDDYDMIIIEDSVEDCCISETMFFYMIQMVNDNKYFIYNKNILNQYHSKESYDLSYSFEPFTGELILYNCGIYDAKSKVAAKESFEKLLNNLYDIDALNGGTYQFSVSDVKNIVVIDGSNIDYIGRYNFSCFSNLESIILPGKCTKIYNHAFEDCSCLSSFDFSDITEVRGYAFSGCKKLSSLNFSNKLISISEYAFKGVGEENLIIPGSVKEIGDYAFASSSVQTIEIEDGVIQVGAFAFAFCKNLQMIGIPKSMAVLGESSFSSAFEIKEIFIELNEQGLELGKKCFSDCNKICDLSIVYGELESARKQLFSIFTDNNCEQNMSNLMQYTKDSSAILKYVGDEVKRYTITLDPNGGSISGGQVVIVEEGSTYPEIPIPIHSNETLIFDGWFTEEGVEIKEGKEVDIVEDCIVKARWYFAESYTVSFYDTVIGKVIETVEVENGKKWDTYLIEGADSSISNHRYQFMGWFTEDDIKITGDTRVNLDSDITLYSRNFNSYSATKYKVHFPEYGKYFYIRQGEKYSKYNIPTPTKQGDILLGWGVNKRVSDRDRIDLKHDMFTFGKDIDLYAIWKSDDERRNTSTNSKLSMIPYYYLNSNNTGKIYDTQVKEFRELNITIFNKKDRKNADWLLKQLLKQEPRNGKVILLSDSYNMQLKKYKKYGIIKTGWDQETFERALTLMYCEHFQYLKMIQTPHFETEEEFYTNKQWKKRKRVGYKFKGGKL
ncbi:MAG: leucine-rich repeat protein [Clostridium sp.]|nr:leucine-rich repeat protein [Clostridium sp.]